MGVVIVDTETCLALRDWTGVETEFNAGFRAEAVTDLEVYSHDPTTCISTLLILNVHYSVSFTTDGTVIIVPIALPTQPKTIIILRDTSALQGVDFQDLISYDPAVHTVLHSRAAMRDGEDKMHRSRMLRVPIGETADQLPCAAFRAGMVLGFDELGQPIAVPPAGGGGGGGGDNLHPPVTTVNAIARYSNTAGRLANSGVLIDNFDIVTGARRLVQSDATPFLELGGDPAVGNFGAYIFHNPSSLSIPGGANEQESKKFYFHRVSATDGTFVPVTLGNNALVAGHGVYLELQPGSGPSDRTAGYAFISWVQSKAIGPSVKAVYGRASIAEGAQGVAVGLVGAVNAAFSQIQQAGEPNPGFARPGNVAWCCQLDYSTGPDDFGQHIVMDSSTGARIAVGVGTIGPLKYLGSSFRSWMLDAAHGSAPNARAFQHFVSNGPVEVPGTITTELLYVKLDGHVVSSLFCAGLDESNCVEITLDAITRAGNGGNLVIKGAQGTGPGSTPAIFFQGYNNTSVFTSALAYFDRFEIPTAAQFNSAAITIANPPAGSLKVFAAPVGGTMHLFQR